MKRILLTFALVCVGFPAMAADEVIVSERKFPGLIKHGDTVPVLGHRITTQVLDVATLSAAFNASTNTIRICNNAGAALWYKIGTGTPSATANTDGDEYLPSGQCVDEPVTAGDKIDTAADS